MGINVRLFTLLATASIAGSLMAPGNALARPAHAAISVPAQPLEQALVAIGAQSGVTVHYDPDAVRGRMSATVVHAKNAGVALRLALAGSQLSFIRNGDGSFDVRSDIVVVAQQNEAETNVGVRGDTTSTRDGLTLREQPRNATVISSKLMDEQQDLTLIDALRNAAGVTVNTATVQGGNSYSVRGFGAGGVVNGLPGASNDGTNAGATMPVAGIERVEVLKGPDAMLAGADNLGGTINVVTKKPFAASALSAEATTGSYGLARIIVDANNPLNDSKTLSARVIGEASTSDHNYGGYLGDQEYLFQSSLRFKNARTDALIEFSTSKEIQGKNPFTEVSPDTNKLFDIDASNPILGKDQGIRIGSTKIYAEVTQHVADWLTLVVRGQHEHQNVLIHGYSPLGVFDGTGTAFISDDPSQQIGNADTIDGYLRLKVKTGPLMHKIVAGYTYSRNELVAADSSASSMFSANIFNPVDIPALPRVDERNYKLVGTQQGVYGQYLGELWKLKFIAGFRTNIYNSTIGYYTSPGTSTDKGTHTVPNYGIIFDATKWLSLYGNWIYGYSPTFSTGYDKEKLPDIRSRNLEGGAKVDLFHDKAIMNLSYFDVRESNVLVTDPAHSGFSMAEPGQEGKGIDFSVSGEVVQHLTVQAGFTHTHYQFLTDTGYGTTVAGQAKNQYNIYASYHRPLAADLSGGVGVGLFGSSSASIDTANSFRTPATRQVNVNGFMNLKGIDFNIGVRNLFNRRNYGISYSSSYIPIMEPRSWRLTIGHKF